MKTILVVDDELDLLELMVLTLSRMQYVVKTAADLKSAKTLLADHPVDLCLTDLRLPDGDGLALVDCLAQKAIPVIVISAYGNVEVAVQALKNGACDFLTKPVDLGHLQRLIKSALKDTKQAHVEPMQEQLLGASKVMKELRRVIKKIAPSEANVMITGPSGVGKELVARLIHDYSQRATAPFVPVNCGAIPQELLESEFFGHKKGSFTGAHADKTGLFAAAAGGTLFLDEVGDLPFPMQVKLLRAIQERAIRPLGASFEQAVDVRIVSATHNDLVTAIAEEAFREDLYYRLNVIHLEVPALAQRREDIPELITYILQGIDVSMSLSPEAIEALNGYDFPGNVRELENILQRAVTLAESKQIGVADLQLPQVKGAKSAEKTARRSLGGLLDDTEKSQILEALEDHRWNRTKAASALGITARALRYRLRKLGIE